MRLFTLILIVLAAIYVLSPLDLIPDFFPISGWLDDAFLVGILVYYLKHGSLPAFLSWLNRFSSAGGRRRPSSHGETAAENDHLRTEKDPFEVLGILPTAGADEIRDAYRRAVQAYHPDKVSHLGPEFKALAEKKFIEIQKAYAQLKQNP